MSALPPGWEVAGEHLIYRSRKDEPPPALPPMFHIPLPQAWFGALFTTYKRKGATIYKDDAYRVAMGYIVYSQVAAYLDGQWLRALQEGFFAVQVEWAEPAAKLPKRERAHGALQVTILIPNSQRTYLIRLRTLSTTQRRFLTFLKSGDLADLEPLTLAAAAS